MSALKRFGEGGKATTQLNHADLLQFKDELGWTAAAKVAPAAEKLDSFEAKVNARLHLKGMRVD